MSERVQFEYATVGHVTIDVLPDGSRRPGGTALYSALQAARLGLRALILTRGVPGEIESLLAPYSGELELQIEPAEQTTTLATSGEGSERRQRMLAWAGPIEARNAPGSEIIHLAPVARELTSGGNGREAFLGLTPQGLIRSWSGAAANVQATPAELSAVSIAEGCDAVVISEQERPYCAALLAATIAAGGLVAVTDGPGPTTLIRAKGEPLSLPVVPLDRPVDDIGAGDVYASALFIALAEGRTPAIACAFAGAAATERMLGVGPAAVATRVEIQARIRSLES